MPAALISPAQPSHPLPPRTPLARAQACLDVLDDERDELDLPVREALLARAAALLDLDEAGGCLPLPLLAGMA